MASTVSPPTPPPPTSTWSDPRVFTRLRHNDQEVRANAIASFETALFRGRMLPLVRGSGACAPPYFATNRMLTGFFVQGTVKQRVPLAEVLTGQAFERPLVNMPSSWIVSVGMATVQHFAPVLRYDLRCERPYMLTPVACVAQCFHAASASTAPPSLDAIAMGDVDEGSRAI